MDLAQLLSTNMPPSVSVGGAAISILAAIGSFVLSRSLERAKAGYQKNLEERKGELQSELEGRKRDLQEDLEGVKAGYQRDLELRKSELQSSLEGQKLFLQKELEEFKAGITNELAAQNARRSYEYDAKKRLYVQVEPLLFQLFEAAEGAFHTVTSLVRSQQLEKLPASLFDANKYYVRSTIHRLFLPLAILRLIQRSTTLVDLNLDPSIRLRYALLKESYLTWIDDFEIAKIQPKLAYHPNDDNWAERRKENQATYWRQGLVIGGLDRLIDAMTVPVDNSTASRRPMNFGEWETAVSKNKELKLAYEVVEDIFLGLEFRSRPVLGRLLVSYACMMHTLMSVYGMPAEHRNLTDFVSGLSVSKDISGLKWWTHEERDVVAEVLPYILKRCQQATSGGYAKF